MRVPLYASEPEELLRRIAARLAAAGIEAQVAPARRPLGPVWDLLAGPLDLLVEHAQLADAEAALDGVEPAPVAGRAAAGGSVVLRRLEAQPGWSDLLASGPGGKLRLVRLVPIHDRRQRDAWERRVRSELWQVTDDLKRTLQGWSDRTALTPQVVSCAPAEDRPALELVLELRAGKADRLPAVWEAGPLPLPRAVRVFRTLIEASRMATGRGLAPNALHPEGFLLSADGRLVWGDVGLQRLLALTHSEASRPRSPLNLAPEEWERDPAGAFRLEALRLVRSLLAGGPTADLPPGLHPIASAFTWAEATHPEAGLLEERWLRALLELGTCGRCGAELHRGRCPACHAG